MATRVRGLGAPIAIGLAFGWAVALSCGPSGGPGTSTGQPDGGGTSGQPSGGGGAGQPPGGDGGSGGQAPAGGSGGTGSGGSSGGDGGGMAGGGGASSGGTGSGGTASGGSSSSGGGTSDGGACAGLGATPEAARAKRFDTGTHASVWRATSDPAGRIALGILGGSFGTEVTFRIFPPDGSSQQGEIALLVENSRTDLDPWFHWTSAGWAGLVHDPPPPVGLRTFDAAGGTVRTSADYAVSSAPDAHGGTVVLAQPYSGSGTSSPSFGPTALEWLDASGNVLRTATLDDAPTMLLVDWNTDHVLAIVPHGARARWYDGEGKPLTPWFAAGGAVSASDASLHLLLDGSVALSDGQAWRGVFRDAVAAMDPPPGWLAARPGTRLATIRHGRGYAVLPMPNYGFAAPNGLDQTSFEVVTASGEGCGKVTLPAPPGEAGVTRSPTALDVGQDGTVLQAETLAGSPEVLGSGIHGEFRWWPALLR
jgi:hypothetical protein